jgi:sialate O-acetylesterase
VRDGQLDAVKSVPGTGLVTTIDLPNPSNNIHLIDKADVGLRLARLVLHGQMGPLYRSSRISGSNMIVQFSHVDGGLVASGQNLNCFSIAGSDRHFVWALAKLKNDTVAVSSAQVPQPAAVRYAWADHPLGCNLFNRNGLPASPFRTDAW